jgi:lipopolysaccharide export system protein LptC
LNDRVARSMPLLLLLSLAILTFWLDQKVQQAPDSGDPSLRHDPDFVIEGFSSTRMNPDGSRRYTLAAQKMVHYPDDMSTQLLGPDFVYFDRQRAPVKIKADTADISANGENAYFNGNVRLTREPYEDHPELLLTTTYLHIIPDQDIAKTDKPATLTEGNSTVSAVGLEFDQQKETLKLLSQVKARYVLPPRSPVRPTQRGR